MKHLIQLAVLFIFSVLLGSQVHAADPIYNLYTPSASTNAVVYSIIVPNYYHAAMNCYVDGAMLTLKKQYDTEAVAAKKIEVKNVKNLTADLPSICTQPWRADATLAQLLNVAEGTVLNQGLLDTMKTLYDGPTKEVDLVKLLNAGSTTEVELIKVLKQSLDDIQKLKTPTKTPESELYRIFMKEYEAYMGFLDARTMFVADEELDVTAWQEVQRRDGKSMDKQYVVFPTKRREEDVLSFQSLQTAKVVLQEFMQTYPMHYEFMAIEQSLIDTGIELNRIQRAITQLLLKLPAIMACQ